ncbi:glycerate kinase [Arthrobacter sp. MPF02]|uniref:glycerate kinase n=1 Tax=Arthrobacter sp. MPF02 TaxID=3388492 RepID=UPI003984BBD2
MKIIIAPDSYKGTASAAKASEAIAAGWASIRPHDDVVLLPMADGGEGTLEAFARAHPEAHQHDVTVEGPNDVPTQARWLMLPDGTAVVEVASTSGITLLDRLRPLTAHTYGLGQAIAHALDNGARRILVALGGSSSTDGGAGALTALGARFGTDTGEELSRGGGALADLAALDLAGLRPPPPGGVLVLTDVTNPLLGLAGAAHVFGPQKGANAADIQRLEDGLNKLASLLPAHTSAPGSGAAGGTAFGLAAWGATITAGAPAVGHEIGLPGQVTDADIVITGEGRYDGQSPAGKVPSYVQDVARSAGARCFLIAGAIEEPLTTFAAYASLSAIAGSSQAAMREPLKFLTFAGAQLALNAEPSVLEESLQPQA